MDAIGTTAAPGRRSRARRGQGDRLREEILAAAERLLLELGDADAVSIRAVASAVGVTPPSIYLHFADKTELIFAVCQVHYDRFNAEIRDRAAGISDPVQLLRVLGRAYLDFGLANPEHYRILFMSRPRETPPGIDMTALLADSVLGDLATAIAEGVAAGRLAGDPQLLVLQAWSAVHGLVSLMITQTKVDWPDRGVLFDHVADGLLRSIQPHT